MFDNVTLCSVRSINSMGCAAGLFYSKRGEFRNSKLRKEEVNQARPPNEGGLQGVVSLAKERMKGRWYLDTPQLAAG